MLLFVILAELGDLILHHPSRAWPLFHQVSIMVWLVTEDEKAFCIFQTFKLINCYRTYLRQLHMWIAKNVVDVHVRHKEAAQLNRPQNLSCDFYRDCKWT